MALGAGPELLNFRANGDFGLTSGDALGSADDFDGDGAKFGFGEVFFLAADQEKTATSKREDGGATRTTERRSLTLKGFGMTRSEETGAAKVAREGVTARHERSKRIRSGMNAFGMTTHPSV